MFHHIFDSNTAHGLVELVEAESMIGLEASQQCLVRCSGKYLRPGLHKTCGEYQSKIPLAIRCPSSSRSEALLPVGSRIKHTNNVKLRGDTGCASPGSYNAALSHGLRLAVMTIEYRLRCLVRQRHQNSIGYHYHGHRRSPLSYGIDNKPWKIFIFVFPCFETFVPLL
jgi:hypothetical protein